MAKPVVSAIEVFDANNGTTAYFKISTGNYTLKQYQYSIYDSLNTTVIDTVTGDSPTYNPTDGYGFDIRPVSGLINRSRSYYLKLRVMLSSESEFGEYSNALVFYCKLKPSLYFENLDTSTDNTLKISSAQFRLVYEYDTIQGETLSNYQYHLYNIEKNLLYESSVYYGDITNDFTSYGFENNTKYYVRGTGTTKNGYQLDTGYIGLFISLGNIQNRSILNVRSDKSNGLVDVRSHVVSIDGQSSGTISYVDLGGGNYAVDLTTGQSVSYEIPYQNETYWTQDFNLRIIVKPVPYKNIVTIKRDIDGVTETISVGINVRAFTDYTDTQEKIYAYLSVECTIPSHLNSNRYVVDSNYLNYSELADEDYILVDILCLDGFFDITISRVEAST